MSLQRTGYGPKIALAAALALLVVAYDVFVAVHLTTAGHFAHFWSLGTLASALSVLVIVIVTTSVCFNVRTLVVRKRQAEAIASRDPSLVGEAPLQPDSALALPFGESLTLTRWHSLNAVFRSLTMVLYLPCAALIGEVVVFQLLPSFGRSSLNPYFDPLLDGPPAPPPTTLDWLAAALPLLLAVGVLGYSVWQNLRDRVSHIVADDRGITVRDGLCRRRILWSEIDLFAHVPHPTDSSSPDCYIVWGGSHSLSFCIPGIEQEPDSEPGFRAWEARYIFDEGYNTYRQNIGRLIATIVARTHIPLLSVRPISGQDSRSERETIIASLTESDAMVLPVAEPRYASSGDPASAASGGDEQVSLRARAVPLPVTGGWSGDFSTLLSPIWILGWAAVKISDHWLITLAIVGVILLFVALYIILFIRQRHYNRLPDVSANEVGLTTWGRYKDQPVTVRWHSITAWVVVPAKEGSTKPICYVVFGDGLRLAWAEPTYGQYSWQSASSDRHGNYRKQAAKLHGLIAARSGQPLREFRSDTMPATQM